MPDSTFFYGPTLSTETDAVTGAPANTGYFKFYTTVAVAGAVAVVGSVPVLLNPVNSGVVARIMGVRFGAVAGTVIAASILYGVSGVITFSSTANGPTPINTFIGRGAACALSWFTTATASAAPTILFPNGISAGGAYAAGPLFTMRDDVNGSIVLPPGASFWPYLSNAALAMTALITVDVIQSPFLPTY